MEFRATARIFADDDRLIEVSPAGWRLLVGSNGASEVLAETAPGASLCYPAAFGERLHLPAEALASADIERVVLGWSNSDITWHLGLILAPPLAEARGSRWCGLARWRDPAADAHRGEAAEAGRALALALARPLAIVPPRPGEVRPAADAPIEPPPPLPVLPYALGDWTMCATGENTLRFDLKPAWARTRIIRAALYVIWALLFLVMSVTSLTTGIMLPQPPFLPYLGFASVAWLLFLALRAVMLARRQPRWVQVDGYAQVVSGPDWQIPTDQIDSIFASQIVKLKKRGAPTEHIRYGEINLFLQDGTFEPLVTRIQLDIKQSMQNAYTDGSMARLTEYNARTPVHAAAVRIARLLGIPAWDDRRID